MNEQNEDHTVFEFSPRCHLVSESAVVTPITPSTDYSTITEDSTPEPKAKIHIDGNANTPRQLFTDNIDNEKELETLRIQVSTLLQNNTTLKEAVKSSEEKQIYTLDGAKKIIAEKDKTIGQLEEKLQKEKLEKKEKNSDLKIMLQNEKETKKKVKDFFVKKQVEFDEAMELLDIEKKRVLQRDNTITRNNEIITRLEKRNERIQENNVSYQYVPQSISYYSGSSSSSSLVSSGGGGGGGQRCTDGSRDMRCKANQGFSKYG
jgi:exonuclease VII large subunit